MSAEGAMGTMDAADQAFVRLADVTAWRGDVFRLLAGAFRDPNPDLIAEHCSGTLVESVSAAVDWLGVDRRVFDEALSSLRAAAEGDARRDGTLRAFKVEYARLFIGPPRPLVSPFASTRLAPASDLGGPVLGIGREPRSVQADYEEAGVQVAAELREPPDHIATEFEFLYFLARRESEAWRAGDDEAARDWRRRQSGFVDAHVKTWALDFFDEVVSTTTESFYRAMAELGSVVIRMEAGFFRPS